MGMKAGQKHDRRFIIDYHEGESLKGCKYALDANIDFICQTSSEVYSLEAASIVRSECHKFLEKYFAYIQNTKVKKLKQFADDCKLRHNDLKQLKEALSSQQALLLYVVPCGTDTIISADNIAYYQKSDLYTVDLTDELSLVYTNQVKPRLFSPLFKGMVRLFQYYYNTGVVDGSSDYLALVNIFITVGNIFNELNLPPKEHELEGRRVLDLLTQPERSIPISVWELFEQFKQDLLEGTLPYISEFNRALIRTSEFRKSPFSEEDYYFSLKAPASKSRRFRERKALLSSVWETDLYKGHPFDDKVGYQSYYKEELHPDDEVYKVLTVMINNPGKVMPRAIHIASNAIQDRCNYVHRRLSRFLGQLPSDCMRDQAKGVRFIKRITSDAYRETMSYPSLFNADFSNATDTLSQEFQNACLSILFDEEIVEFWRDISKCNKKFRLGSNLVDYVQHEGQPQGLLGSFDAFSLAHHVIFLLSMKKAGLEDVRASHCYVVLGDDSAASSVKPNVNLLDIYEEIATNVGLQFNRNKAGVVHQGPDYVARLDFAKVTVCNGDYDSPIPSRIFFRTSRTEKGEGQYYKLAVLMWLNSHGRRTEGVIENVLYDTFGHEGNSIEYAMQLFKGGLLPVFDEFTDPLVSASLDSKLILAYLVHKIKSTFVEAMLGDKFKEEMNLGSIKDTDSVLCLLPKREVTRNAYFDEIPNMNHKFMLALKKNSDVEESLRFITGDSSIDWALAAAALYLSEQEVITIGKVAVIFQDVTDFGIEDLDNQELLKLARDLNDLSRFEFRSIAKKRARSMSYFDEIISIREQLENTSLFSRSGTSVIEEQ